MRKAQRSLRMSKPMLEAAGRVAEILEGERYKRRRVKSGEDFVYAIICFFERIEADFHDLVEFGPGERVNLFGCGPYGVFGEVWLDENGFFLDKNTKLSPTDVTAMALSALSVDGVANVLVPTLIEELKFRIQVGVFASQMFFRVKRSMELVRAGIREEGSPGV